VNYLHQKKTIMKKILLLIAVFTILAFAGRAQCNGNVNFISSKSQMVNQKGEVLGSKDGTTVIEITKKSVSLTFNGDEKTTLAGEIKEEKCEWGEPFKNGKSIIKAVLEDAGGDVKHVTLTIEAKDGKITITGDAEERPNERIKFDVDKYELK